MALLDRDEVLGRTNLVELVEEVCGLPHGRGRGARWHCPSPDHPDVHPSMSVYDGGAGQRWKCHACGQGGTAIDLLMISSSMSAGEAIRELGRRTGVEQAATAVGRSPATSPRWDATSRRQPDVALVPAPAIEEFVAEAELLLWGPEAGLAQRTLTGRGFSEALLRVNRVGFDPGPGRLPRPSGLPYRSPGIVFPVLDASSGRAVFYQVRSLSPRHAAERKYDQPTSQLAPNPKLAAIRLTQRPVAEVLVVAEGIPDGLTAALAGFATVAVLGVGHAGADSAGALAQRIVREHPMPGYAVCFDPDGPGREAGARLADRLAYEGAEVAKLQVPARSRDLNDWWRTDARTLVAEMAGTGAVLAV